jgi:hypothetical protein
MVNTLKKILLLSILYGCGKDAPILLPPHIGNELRLDGFYYSSPNSDSDLFAVYFFYKNGVVRYGYSSHSLTELEGSYKTNRQELSKENMRNRVGWGVVNISGDDIKFETWGSSSGGSLKTLARKGKVLNDSTFVINEAVDNYTGRIYKDYTNKALFKFKKFSPKLDSTNNFVP